MKIELLDHDKLISVNHLKEVTSSKLFSTKMIFDPEGILSNEIFGISKNDRRLSFAYINLHRRFLHPHIYENILKRIFRNITYLLSGQKRFSIKNGILIEDNNGWTGLANLYDNWDSINWNKFPSANKKALQLLSKAPKDLIFIDKIVVCPPAYRDVLLSGSVDTSDYVCEINKLYNTLIRSIALLNQGGLFSRTQYAIQCKIQDTLGEITKYFKGLISKKSGLIRQNLLGKSVDFGTRSVISGFAFNNEKIEDNMVDLEHCALPISQCCSTFYPFIETWIKNFFTKDIINNPNIISFYDPDIKKEVNITLSDTEKQFSDKNIKKLINDYIFNPDNRFKPIIVNGYYFENKKKIEVDVYVTLKGKIILENNVAIVLNRPATVTDILYLACVDVCEKRHVLISRYPVGNDKGLLINKVRVQSTSKHMHVIYNGKEYLNYPYIDLNLNHEKVGIQFIDTLQYANASLDGMGEL